MKQIDENTKAVREVGLAVQQRPYPPKKNLRRAGDCARAQKADNKVVESASTADDDSIILTLASTSTIDESSVPTHVNGNKKPKLQVCNEQLCRAGRETDRGPDGLLDCRTTFVVPRLSHLSPGPPADYYFSQDAYKVY